MPIESLHGGDVMLIEADARHLPLDDESVQCCITSPPYWGLRQYDVPDDDMIGLEPTPEAWIENMLAVFREVWRVLRPDGILFVNVGDAYASGTGGDRKIGVNDETRARARPQLKSLKPKDLIGLPWMLAFALRNDGWYLRSDIIWAKPNQMPESVTDRPTKSHEHLFLLSKSARYYYDNEAVREKHISKSNIRDSCNETYGAIGRLTPSGAGVREWNHPNGRNLRDVWFLSTQAVGEKHFATFPEKLVEPCIKAGTSERGCCPECGGPWVRVVETIKKGRANYDGSARAIAMGHSATGPTSRGSITPDQTTTTGWQPTCHCPEHEPIPCTVLDPFGGSGTTALVALKLGRRAISADLGYHNIARKRLTNIQPVMPGIT